MRIEREVAIVTGAGRGIGFGIARALVDAGLRVAIADMDGEAACASASRLGEGKAFGWALDVADAAGWERFLGATVARFGGLDVLVNNAGISTRGTAESTDEALWDRTINTNLKGAWLGIRAALSALKARRGAIVNIGSTHATIPLRNLLAYSASKAGLWGLTKQVAIEYLHDGITCNMISPGWVASEGERAIQAAAGRLDFPAGIWHMSSPEDVGEAVLYVISEAARHMTGDTIHLDGGLHAFGDVRWVHFADGP